MDKQDLKKNNEQSDPLIQLESDTAQQNVVIDSQQIEFYQQFFSSFPFQPIDQFIKPFQQRLSDEMIHYSPAKFHSFSIFILNETKTKKVTNLLVKFSFFTFEVTVLNLGKVSVFSEQLSKSGFGGTANIYRLTVQQSKNFVVKSVRINQKKPLSRKQETQESSSFVPKTVQQAIKQYCFTKLFSVLEIGPKVYNYFGFDLLVSNNSVEFCLEECSPYKQIDVKVLQRSLKILHSLQIIHGDIKPGNIMWSHQHSKIVFIDFGFSEAVHEKPGQLTYTSFFGTLGFACPEMVKLFTERSFGFVDLYYNDAICMEKSIYNQQFKLRLNFLQEKQKKQLLQSFIFNWRLSSFIFQRNLKGASQFLKLKDGLQISTECIQMFWELPPQSILYRMYCLFIKHMRKFGCNTDHFKDYYFHFGESQQLVISPEIEFDQQFQTHSFSDRPHLTVLMYNIFVEMGQDTTPRAKHRKRELRKILQTLTQIEIGFCELLVQQRQKKSQFISNYKQFY